MKSETLTAKQAIFILIALTLLVYGNTFLNDWTYDDIPVVVKNPDAHSLAGFLEDSRPGRPLRELSYIPEYLLFGSNPAGYHIQQLFWHGSNGCLVFVLLTLLGIEGMPAFLGAALFLVHPLQAESVANISHRKELLALCFGLAAVIAYIKGVARPWRQRLPLLLGALLAFALALLANQTAISLPLVLILYDYLFVPPERRLLLRKPLATLLSVAVIGGLFAYRYRWLFRSEELLTIYSKNAFIASKSWLPLEMGALKAFGFYLGKILLPVKLAPEYVIRLSESMVQPLAWGSLLLLAALLALFWYTRKRQPAVAFGIGWFMALYLPISNVLPVAYIIADRYMYLCLPGVALVVAGLVQHSGRRVLLGVGGGLVVFAVLTVIQNGYWRNEHTLWRHAARVNPGSTWAQESAALSYYLTGELSQAEAHARKALELHRFNTMAYLTLARILEKQGRIPEALEKYEMFIAVGELEHPDEVAEARQRVMVLRQTGTDRQMH